MAIKEKEIIKYLRKEGFKEINAEEKLTQWYKKASVRPQCLKRVQKKGKIKNL